MANPITVQDPGTGQVHTLPMPANVARGPAPGAWMLDPAQFAVNVANQMEMVTQSLFHYQAYPAAGSAQPLQFFGVVPGGAVTPEDTNMQLAGQLPAPQKFLIQGIAIDYLPGTAAARFGAQSALGQIADFYAIGRRGLFTLTIGSKNYFTDTTIFGMPPRGHANGVAAVADATTAGAALQTFVSLGFSDGDVMKPVPLLIEASQNFSCSIAYPGGAVPIPSADAAARIGVRLYGQLYRPAQ